MSEEVTQVETLNEQVETAPDAADNAEALSFDDLDNLTDGRSNEEIVSEARKEAKNPGSGKKNEPQDEGLGNEEAEQVAKEASKEEVETEPEEEKEAEESIKKITGKAGNKKYELTSDTVFSHKVDGEEVDVTLQDLLNNYSGKTSYDRKFQEFSESKKELEAERNNYQAELESINEYIGNFAQKIQQDDAMGALEYFAEFSGMKPYEFRNELVRQLAPEVERRSLLSYEEIENENLRQQNEYLLRQQESAEANRTSEQAKQELGNKIRQMQEAHGISDEDFEKSYYELVESNYEGDVTPDVVAEYYVHTQAYSRAESVLETIDTNLRNQQQIVENFQRVIVNNPDFDDNDLKEIAEEVYGDFKKKASKSVSKKLPKAEKPQTKSNKKEDYVSFEDF
tara:strand:- start:2536 stop:3726 length:1191 start_codon:yes stop_codon:yes gene_type:complete